MEKQRRIYDPEFKKKAVELSNVRGNVVEIADELGIRAELIYRWRREHKKYKKNSFPGKVMSLMSPAELHKL